MTVPVVLSLAIWVYLLGWHGRFWQAGPILPVARPAEVPDVAVVIPARDEAPLIEATLRSLLGQRYPGRLRIILVDDNSTDGTGGLARALGDSRLTVIAGADRPAGWSGKLWAVAQGVAYGVAHGGSQEGPASSGAELILLTDADIVHEPDHVSALVARLVADRLDLVSEMVQLACDSVAERALVPAFVFFFQLLYPFAWVNDARRRTAAAAGGTILVRAAALARIGGIAAVKGALIDDVALAAAVKKGGPIYLGHSALARSVRPYPGFADIWRMVARTAFVQLRHSWLLLLGTVLGMALVWLVPPAAALFGSSWVQLCGTVAWVMLAASYVPTLRRFGRSILWAPFLPLVAVFYMAATIGSAINHAAGRGVAWKGRAYQGKAQGNAG